MRKLRIVFDGQLFLKGNKTGIGWCAENIIRELAKNNKNEYICEYFQLGHSKKQVNNLISYENMGIELRPCRWFNNILYKLIWNIIPVPYYLFFGKKRDVTIFFNFIIPPGVNGKKIVIVHDMAYKVYPKTVNIKTRKWLESNLEKSCSRADIIVTVSEFSKSEIMKYLNISSNKILVMPNGIDFTIYHTDYLKIDIETCKEKYNIEGDYFLYLGTLEPRKNLIRLIQAYAQLKKNIKKAPKLVLAGEKGWYYKDIFRLVDDLKLKSDIIFTGYILSADVPLLMNGAKSFVYPSLYEGFGMPPLEAMACGVPVVVSNTSAIPEVIGEAGIYVEPLDIDSIEKGLIKSLEPKEEMIQLGRRIAQTYTWERSVGILYKIIGDNG